MFCNDTQTNIDSVASPPIGELITDLYRLTPGTSLVMRCLAKQQPLLNQHLIYKTRLGRRANSICSVFLLFSEKGLPARRERKVPLARRFTGRLGW